MAAFETMSATEFKAKCLDVLDRIGTRQLQRLTITKRGRVVAMLVAPETEAAQAERLYGFMRGSVIIPPSADLTAPVADEQFEAERGEVHG